MVPQMKWDLFPKICSSFLLLLCLYNIISLLGPMQIFVVTVSLHEQFAKKKITFPHNPILLRNIFYFSCIEKMNVLYRSFFTFFQFFIL